jgi:hypothetical protein
MMRLGGRGLRTTICVAVATAAFSACTDTNTSLFILGNLYREAPNCGVSADPSAEMLGAGSLDLAFSNTYSAALLVGNQMTARGSKSQLRAETKRVNLQGAEVTLTDLAGRVLEPAFSVAGAGFADVTSGESPGWGVVFVDLIPRTVGAELANDLQGTRSPRTIIAEARVFGTTIGGGEVESGPFVFPIEVCYGCRVFFPLDAMTVDANGNFVCGANAEGFSYETCHPGQDETIDCRACAASSPDVCLSP